MLGSASDAVSLVEQDSLSVLSSCWAVLASAVSSAARKSSMI